MGLNASLHPDRLAAARRREGGFTLTEILIGVTILAIIVVFVLATFTHALTTTGRSNERSAATTLGAQIMEQIRASVNPYTMVGFDNLPRTPLAAIDPASPYYGVRNPTPYVFELAVTVVTNDDLTITTATVEVFRPAESGPLVSLTTILDNQ